MKKSISVMLILCFSAAICLSLSACGAGKTGGDSAVVFLNGDADLAAGYQEIAEEYEKEKGVKVTVINADRQNYTETLKTELKKSNAPTLFTLDNYRDYTEVKEYCADLKNGKLYASLYDKTFAIKDGMDVRAIPYRVTGYGILYNQEITDRYFALPDKKSPLSSMEEIKNHEQLKTVVEDMSKHLSELKIKGVFASTSLASGEEERFSTHLLGIPLSMEAMEKDGDARENLAGMDSFSFRYGDQYRDTFDLYTKNSVTDGRSAAQKTNADAAEEFAAGQAAMMQGTSRQWEQIRGANGATIQKEKVKFLPIYTGIEGEEKRGLAIGADGYLAINIKASDPAQKNAADFAEWLFTSENGKKAVSKTMTAAMPFNTFAEEDLPDNPLIRETARFLKNSAENVMMAFDRVFPDAEYYQKVADGLRGYASGEKSWDEVKSSVTSNWKKADYQKKTS